MKNYVVLADIKLARIAKIFVSDHAEDERLGEVFQEWQESYRDEINSRQYDLIVARTADFSDLKSKLFAYDNWDAAEWYGPGIEQEYQDDEKKVFVLLVNESKMRIIQIWTSEVLTDENLVEISKKAGEKFGSLPREHGCGFDTIMLRAKNMEAAKLQLSFGNGNPYHTGWYTAERSCL